MKFFDNIIEFFVPEEDEQKSSYPEQKESTSFFENIHDFFFLADEEETHDSNTEEKSCTEQEKPTETQRSKNMSNTVILLKSIKDGLFAACGLLSVPALIMAVLWSDAGDYSRGVMLRGIPIFVAVVFFIAFAVQYSDLSHTKAKAEGTEEPLLSRFLGQLIGYIMIGICLCILIAFVYLCGRQDIPEIYKHLPFRDKVEQIVEKSTYFIDDVKGGAYEYVDTYEVKLVKVSAVSGYKGRTRYIYIMENSSGEEATFSDSGALYTSICEGYEVGDKIPLPITLCVDLMEKDGEQYYFYNDNKLQKVS